MLAKTRKLLILAAAVLLPHFWLSAIRFVALDTGAESSADAYYHVAMADRFPGACVSKTFPAMTLSLWKDSFYDKELAYHGIIWVLRGYTRIMGLPHTPPFHVPALFFPLVLLGIFVLMARAWQIPAAPVFSLLLVMGCPFFTQRLLMLRPHVLAIALVLAFAWRLTGLRKTSGLWWPFCFGFLMAYAYSNPHFILLPAVVFAAFEWKKHRKLAVLTPLVAIAGIAAGLVIHPQFPNTLLLWKIQSLDVIGQSIRGAAPVYVGTELHGPTAKWLVQNAALYVMLALSVAALRKIPRGGRAPETVFFFTLAAIAGAGTLLSKRAIEYAWPFTVVSGALLLRDLVRTGYFKRWTPRTTRRAVAAVYTTLAVGVILLGVYMARWIYRYQTHDLSRFEGWARDRIGAGTIIANVNWSDFPQLFFSAPQYRYLMGMEPMFAYHASPAVVAELEAFRTGMKQLTPVQLAELTGARYAFVSIRNLQLAEDMRAAGFIFVYEGPDGWLFDLEAVLPRPL